MRKTLSKEEQNRLITKALNAFSEGKAADAITLLEDLLKEHPKNINALCNLGTIHCENGAPQKAIILYEQALTFSPQNALLWFNLSVAYCDNNEFAKALKASEEALILVPHNQKFWLNHGYLLKQAGIEITLEIFDLLKEKIANKRRELGLKAVEIY